MMKNIKYRGILGLVGLAILTFSLTIFLVNPGNAINTARNETSQQEYPSEEVQLANNSLVEAIYEAEDYLAVMPEDIPLRFDLGTNYPIPVGWLPDEGQLTRSGYEALGYIDLRGVRQAVTPRQIRNIIFEIEQALNQGGVSGLNQMLQGRINYINLVARKTSTNQTFLINEANVYAVARDAINAILNQTLRENNQNQLW